MYKQLAAYAAALIRKPETFVVAVNGEDVVWGLRKDGKPAYAIQDMDKISILGAIRGANEVLCAYDSRKALNSLYRAVELVGRRRYGVKYTEADHRTAVAILEFVARNGGVEVL